MAGITGLWLSPMLTGPERIGVMLILLGLQVVAFAALCVKKFKRNYNG